MKKVLLIGQAPPKTNPERPFGRSYLYKWLASVGIDFEIIDKWFEFGALIDYFPGLKGKSHKLPDKNEIKAGRKQLAKLIISFKPEILVPIGKLSITESLQNENLSLEETVGAKFTANPYGLYDKEISIIPLPHPSGASSWYYKPQNKVLLEKSLSLLSEELNGK